MSRAGPATPLLLVEVALIVAVLLLLGPVLFLRRRDPFERLVVLLELVLVRVGTRMVCVVAAPEGVRVVTERHPEVKIYAAALDRHRPRPGRLRLFGTE